MYELHMWTPCSAFQQLFRWWLAFRDKHVLWVNYSSMISFLVALGLPATVSGIHGRSIRKLQGEVPEKLSRQRWRSVQWKAIHPWWALPCTEQMFASLLKVCLMFFSQISTSLRHDCPKNSLVCWTTLVLMPWIGRTNACTSRPMEWSRIFSVQPMPIAQMTPTFSLSAVSKVNVDLIM